MPSAKKDNIHDEIDYSDLEKKYAVEEPVDMFDNMIVIDNLPKVDEKKLSKLVDVLAGKIFKKQAKITDLTADHFFMPKDESGTTRGFCFVTLKNGQDATAAVKALNNYQMDKSHCLAVNLFDDVQVYSEMSAEYAAPEEEEYVEKEHLKSWMMDPQGRDQWVQLAGDEVSILWNNRMEDPELVHSRPKWSEFFVQWSPKGSYLCTFHRQGAQVWGGAGWKRLMRFPHPNVKLVDFSPNEKYVVTWSVDYFETEEGDKHNIVVWDLPTGEKLRSFAYDISTLQQPDDKKSPVQTVKVHWPLFKWSHDDKYIAKMNFKQSISVYELPGMGLLNKTSIKVPDVQHFEWSPSDHILSYWTPETGNIPARVTLMDIPSRNILRTKNLFKVTDVKMKWQSEGKYLLVQVTVSKSKTKTAINFELFRLKEKDVPIDNIDVKINGEITSIEFEPKGDRFIVVSNELSKCTANVYNIESVTSDTVEPVTIVKTIDCKNTNRILWSPAGRFCVLACIGGSSGDFEFWDMDMEGQPTKIASSEHYLCTDAEWDPTGRFLVSSVSYWQVQSDNGFIVWNFDGKMLFRRIQPHFKQFIWRPRPPSLLTAKDMKKIRRNIKKYAKEFEKEDLKSQNKASREVIDKRLALMKEWQEYRQKCIAEYEKQRKEREGLFVNRPADDELAGLCEEVVEEYTEVVEDEGTDEIRDDDDDDDDDEDDDN